MTYLLIKKCLKMSKNFYDVLDSDSDYEPDSIPVPAPPTSKSDISKVKSKASGLVQDIVNSELSNSELSNSKLIKDIQYRKSHKSVIKTKHYSSLTNQRESKVNQKQIIKIYDEIANLPSSFKDAIRKKQDLTVKQILIIMKLQGIPTMVINNIHDKIQKSVRRMFIKISHEHRVFSVSFYHWYDLEKIESIIHAILNPY